ncbi:dipeptidase PepE [Rhizosphaericola mali]|uniref:Dipeptidase PepE n=1 Tax=Rhizosphaericola mali TaxID=2545455 RepID=A0A5P2G9J6_9BACT|nr:dipeptidase PepE [Rhizosphaericola mali]QES90390.1 dipeptidase PepE [Rhizosphaericola mali]
MIRNIILASTSTLFGGQYLEYLKDELLIHFSGVKKLLFIPFARPSGISYDEYTNRATCFFKNIGIEVVGIHTVEKKIEAIEKAEAIFTGGGNTFLLVQQLYKFQLLDAIRNAVNNGTPYLGCSAGTNIGGLSMKTTNDMPIVYPPSFDTLGLVPFNLNPHYLDPDPHLKHNGETRETRILEFLSQNETPVVGLREGSWLYIKDDKITLKGNLQARIFEKNKTPYEIPPMTDLSLLK